MYADHLVTCPFMQGNERTITHAAVVKFCDALNHAAHIPSLIEPRGPFVASDEIIQPNGHVIMERRYLDLWSGDGHLRPDGTGTLADVTGFHAMANAVYDNQDIDVTALLSQRVRLKNAKYHNAVNRIGYNFLPLVFESYSGLLHKDFVDFISKRSRIIATRLGIRPAVILRNWLSRLSCILRRMLALTVMNRLDRLLSIQHGPLCHDIDQVLQLQQPLVVYDLGLMVQECVVDDGGT